jgi:Arc/MetJ-type ribon-helix-helix transcriptional regulator
MAESDLIHIRVGKEMKKRMQDLIEIGMFSTESEIAREGIRNLLIKYLKEAGLEKSIMYTAPNVNKENNEKNERKK